MIVLLSTGGNNGGGYLASKHVVFAFHAGILLSHAAINSLSITWLSLLGQFAALWNMLGTVYACVSSLHRISHITWSTDSQPKKHVLM